MYELEGEDFHVAYNKIQNKIEASILFHLSKLPSTEHSLWHQGKKDT